MKKDKKSILMKNGGILISHRGYYATRVEDITKESGVAKGTFYIYFKSKEEMFITILNEKLKEYLETSDRLIKKKVNLKWKIYNLTLDFLKLITENIGIFKTSMEISCIEGNATGEKIRNIMIESNKKIIENICLYLYEGLITREINEKYKNSVKELALIYDTIRTEYFFKKLMNISFEKQVKKVEYTSFNSKFDGINAAINEINIEKEAEFITDMFFGGVQKS